MVISIISIVISIASLLYSFSVGLRENNKETFEIVNQYEYDLQTIYEKYDNSEKEKVIRDRKIEHYLNAMDFVCSNNVSILNYMFGKKFIRTYGKSILYIFEGENKNDFKPFIDDMYYLKKYYNLNVNRLRRILSENIE